MSEQTTPHWMNGNSTMMADRAASCAHDAIDLVATRLGDAEERARDVAAATLARLEATRVQAKQKIGSATSNVGGFFRTEPAVSIGLAFAAGFLAVEFLRRR